VKHIPPFSKEMYEGDTVSNKEGSIREGFLDNVDIHKCPDRKPVEHMAAFYPVKSTLERTSPQGNPAHPEFKNKSDDGMPDFPAPFSKTSIKGGPKKPGTPA
jgi:hypothetical protein